MKYRDLEQLLAEESNNFTDEEYAYSSEDIYDADMAYEILKNYYSEVNRALDIDDDSFTISCYEPKQYTYEESYKTSKSKIKPDFKFFKNPSPWVGPLARPDSSIGEVTTAAPAGGAVGLGESYEDPEEPLNCPNCNDLMQFKGANGFSWKYFCPKCKEWFLLEKGDKKLRFGDNGLEPIEEDIQKHDDLNQDLFDGNELKDEVKDKLLEIADKFNAYLIDEGIDLDIQDICIVGSSASYNYNDKSDIDLHIFADTSKYGDKEDLVKKLCMAYKSIWNDKYSPTIYGHEVEVYVEPAEELQA